MARFNAWVNDHFYDHAARLNDTEYRMDRSALFGSIHRTLNHILAVDRLWMGGLQAHHRGQVQAMLTQAGIFHLIWTLLIFWMRLANRSEG